MALRIPIGGVARIELTGDRLVRWRDLSRGPNRDHTKPWIQHVLEPHDDFVVTGDWLPSETVGGDVCFDLSGIGEGDILKVSGASNRRKEHAFYLVTAADYETDGLRVERISVDAALDIVESAAEPADEPAEDEEKTPAEALKQHITERLAECDDDRVLWDVLERLEEAAEAPKAEA